MTFSEQLKLDTSKLHRKVDQDLFKMLKMEPVVTGRIFSLWYQGLIDGGFLEGKTSNFISDFQIQKAKSFLPATYTTQIKPMLIENNDQWLGCYYVVRGSCLGSKIICRHIKEDNELWNYFHWMAGIPDEGWRKLKKIIDEQPQNVKNDIIIGASRTFEYLLDLIKNGEQYQNKNESVRS